MVLPVTVLELPVADIASDRDALNALAEVILNKDPAERRQWLAELSDDHLDVVSMALGGYGEDGIGWRADPLSFALALKPGAFRRWRYVQLLARKFRHAVIGKSKRQIWNIESRYGKSQWGAQYGPAWGLDFDPTLNLILSSYGDVLAMENAYAVRAILREHVDKVRVTLEPDRQQINRFKTTEGGGLLAAGISSAISGFPGDGIILDDPFKDWIEAHSEARRNLVENQYRAVLRMRAESEDAFIIVIHNRWHEDDLSGRLIKQMEDGTGEQWDVVRLPTRAEAPNPDSPNLIDRLPDPLGRAPGEVLEPERFSEKAVADRALSIGSYLSSAMQQQRPTPEEGNDVKRAWFRLADRMPDRADEWISSWDMKLKDKEGGDYVVGQLWARTGTHVWLMEQLRGQWNQPTTVNAIALMAVRWPECTKHWLEATGNYDEVMTALSKPEPDYEVSDEIAGILAMTVEERDAVNDLRRFGMSGLLPNPVTDGSKRVQMRGVTPYIEAGHVHLPARAPWLGAYLDEVAAFPNGTHDDQVDSTSQALTKLLGRVAPRKRGQSPQLEVAATTV